MSTLENAELQPKPPEVDPKLLKAAYDIPGQDPRDRMVQVKVNDDPRDLKAPDDGKLKQNESYSINFRPQWLDEPKTLDKLKNLDPSKVSDFFSRGLGIRPQDQIPESGITDKQFLQVAGGWSNLKHINIGMTELTNGGLKSISEKFKKVEELHIDGTKIENEGLDSLAALKSLKILDINNTKVSDAGMAKLKGLTGLEELNLGYDDISDRGLEPLKELKNLKVLLLNDTRITDAGLQQIAQMPKLEHLALSGTAISDRGLGQIKDMPNLKTLILTDTNISDQSIASLEKMQNLERLTLVDTNFTAAGIKRLQKALPNCQIFAPPPPRKIGPDVMASNSLPPLSIS